MRNETSRIYPRALYSVQVIRRAAADYREICRIANQERPDATICRFADSRAPLPIVMGEFSNYLIELLHAGESRGGRL